MASQHKITIGVDFQASIGSVQNAVKNIQSGLQSLKLPSNMAKSFESTFSKLETEFTKFSAKASNKEMTFGDFKDLEKSGKQIINLYNQLKVQVKSLGNLSNTELKKMFPDSFAGDIKKATDSWKTYEAEMKKVASTTKTQEAALKKLQKTQASQAKALESAKSKKVVSDVEYSSLQKQKNAASKKATKIANDNSNIIAKYEAAAKTKSGKLDMRQSGAKELLADYNAAKQAIDEATLAAEKLSKRLEGTISTSSLDKLQNEYDETTKKINNTETEIKDLQKLGSQNAFEKLKQSLGDLGEDISGIENTEQGLQQLYGIIDKLISAVAGELRDSVDRIGSEFNESSGDIDRFNRELDEVGIKSREVNSAMGEIDNLKQQVTYFFGLQNAIQLARRAMSSTIETIKELDAAMTETAVVTDFSVGDMWETLPQYTDMANDLGVAIKDVYNASTLYYQQGLKTNQVTALTNETLKMARIGGMEAAEATDRMTNALRGFNMEINEANAQRINDVYSNLAAISAANTDEISNAMTKTASIAANAGSSYENTAAFLTQIIETTRESSETAGTALKTIIARFNEMKVNPNEITEVDGEEVDYNKIDSALKSVGISLKDARGQIRDFDDIILELSGKWDTLDKNTRSYIATTAAGSRQQSRFIALMSNNARLTELVSEANNSAGASNKQFEKTLESMETKLQKLKNAWNSFLLGITDSEIIKASVDVLTWLIEGVNKFTEALGPVGQILSRITILILGLKAGKKIFDSLFDGLGKFSNLGAKTGIKEGLEAGAVAAGPAVYSSVKNAVEQGAKDGFNQAEGKNTLENTVEDVLDDNGNNGGNKKSGSDSLKSKFNDYKTLFKNLKSTKDINGNVTKPGILKTSKDNFFNFKSNLKSTGGKGGAIGGAVGGAIAGAAAGSWAGKLITGWMGAGNRLEDSLNSIGSAFSAVSSTVQETTSKLEEFDSLKEEIKTLQNTLKMATKGSEEYNAALKKNNSEIRNIIRENPELAKQAKFSNGQWQVDDSFWNDYETTLQRKQASAENSQNALGLMQEEADYAQQRQKSGIDTSEWTDEEKKTAEKIGQTTGAVTGAVTGLAAGALTGAAVGAAVGTVVPGLGNIIGAVAGTIIGGIAGLLSGGLMSAAVTGITKGIQTSGIKQSSFDNAVAKFASEGWSLDQATIEAIQNGDGLNDEQLEIKEYLDSVGITNQFLKAVSDNTEEFMRLVDSSEALKQQQVEYAYEIGRANGLIKEGNTGTSELYNRLFTETGIFVTQTEVDAGWKNLSDEEKEKYRDKVLEEGNYKYDKDNKTYYNEKTGKEVDEETIDEIAKSKYKVNKDNEKANKFAAFLNKRFSSGNDEINFAKSVKWWDYTKTYASDGVAYENFDYTLNRDVESIEKGSNYLPSKGKEWTDKMGEEWKDKLGGSERYEKYLLALADAMGLTVNELLETFGDADFKGADLVKTVQDNVRSYKETWEDLNEEMGGLSKNQFYNQTGSIGAGLTSQKLAEFGFSNLNESAMAWMGDDQEAKEKIANIYATADLETRKGIGDFVNKLDSLGVDLSAFGDNLTDVTNRLAEMSDEVVTQEQRDQAIDARAIARGISEKTDKRSFSATEYSTIVQSVPELAGDFIENDDGSYTYLGDSIQDLIVAINQNTSALLGKTTELDQDVKTGKLFKGANALSTGFNFGGIGIDENGNYTGIKGMEAATAKVVDAYMKQYGVDLETAANATGYGDLYDQGGLWTNSSDGSISAGYSKNGTTDANLKKAMVEGSQHVYETQTNYDTNVAQQNAQEQQEQIESYKTMGGSDLVQAISKEKNAEGQLTEKQVEGLSVLKQKAVQYGVNLQYVEDYEKALKSGTETQKKEAKAALKAQLELSKQAKQWDTASKSIKDYIEEADGIEDLTENNKLNLAEALSIDDLDKADQLKFIENNFENIKKAITGDVDALYALQNKLAEQYGFKINAEGHFEDLNGELAATDSKMQALFDLYQSLGMFEIVEQEVEAGATYLAPVYDDSGMLTGFEQKVAKETLTVSTVQPKGREDFIQQNSYSGGGGSGSSGGGGGGSEDKYEPEYDKFYNHLEKINSLLRKREKLEKRYQQMIDKGSHTADNLYKNHKKQLSLIKQEKSAQEEMVKLRNQEMKDYLAENSDLSKYATYKNGMIAINRDAIYAITDSEKGEKVDTYISKLEEIRDQIQEAEDAVIDLEDALIEEERRFKENYESFEEQVYDAVVASREREIEALSSLNTTITNAASELLDGVQKNLDQIRQERENEKTEQDLADKQARLAYLRLDTSGANASEIKALEKELGEAQEDYTDTLIDQKINELQKQNDEAAKQREEQIKLLEDSLAIDKQTGALWPQVYDLIKNDLNIKGVAPGSKLDDLLKKAAEYFSKSASQKENYNKETNLKAQEAYNYGREGQFARNSFDSFVRSEGLGIDANSDIQAKINEALSNGNWSLAKDLETARNLKIDAGLAPSGTKKTYTYQNIGEDWAAIMPKLYGIRSAYYAAWKARVQKVKDIEGAYYENFDYTHIINEAKAQGQTEWQKLAEYYRNKKLGKKGTAPSKIPAYLHGGLVDMTGPAWLDGTKSRPEIVLNAKDTQNFLELTEALRASNPNLGAQNSKNGDIFFNIDIHVDQLTSDYDVDQVANQVKQIIQTDAQWRNVNAVGNIR